MKILKCDISFYCPNCDKDMPPLKRMCTCGWWEFPSIVSGCDTFLDGVITNKKKFKVIYAEG